MFLDIIKYLGNVIFYCAISFARLLQCVKRIRTTSVKPFATICIVFFFHSCAVMSLTVYYIYLVNY